MCKIGANKPLILLLLLIYMPVKAEVILQEQLFHYAIAPTSINDIKLELRKHTPVSKENKLYHGGTQWKLKPLYGWRIEGNLCWVRQVSVYLQGSYTLPEMSNRGTASANLVEVFDDYYTSLLHHEKGHQALWIEAGEEIERILKSMPPHFQCEQLKNQANNRVNKIVEKYQQLNRKYDTNTGFGKTQGVYIAPRK